MVDGSSRFSVGQRDSDGVIGEIRERVVRARRVQLERFQVSTEDT